MIKKNIKKEMDEYFKKDKTQEIHQISNNIESKINKNASNEAFINPNTNPKLILDYIPQELFMSFKKKNIIVNENNQINEKSISPQIDNKFDIDNNSKNNLSNNILSSNEINKLKNNNVCENNHFNSLYFNDKNKELETSKKNNSNTNTDTKNKYDFQITDNRFNISELFTNNKGKNNNINNDSNKQNIKYKNLPTNSSKDTLKNMNKRYNEELSYFDSFDINKNINSNISNNNNNNIIKTNILSNNIINNLLSSNSSYNNSTCNGYSDHYINSVLNISNTLTNNSNYYSNSLYNNYGEKNKLRNIENKEKMIFEMENERHKKINELIEGQKNLFLQKEKEIQEKELMEEEKMKKEELKSKNKTNENFKYYNNTNDKENYNENFFISKEKESCYDNIRSYRNNQEKTQINNGSNKEKKNQNIDCNNQFNNNQNDLKYYFRDIKNENINNVEKISNRTNYNNNNNYFYNNSNVNKEATSFYTKKSQIVSPFISSVITDNNIINKTSQNFNKNNKKNKKNFKSTKNFSKISKTSNKIKNSGTVEDYQTSSLQMSNLLNNDNKYETYLINEIIRSNKQNKLKRNKSKRDFNFVGKEKIAKKYNLYFNCFDPKLYEEQREKLLNDRKGASKMKKSKSMTKILVLDDDIGPNLYNEQIENPDIGYIIYKTNKKINSNYSLNSINTLNSNYRNYNNNQNQKIFYNSNQSINSIEIYKNNYNKLYF